MHHGQQFVIGAFLGKKSIGPGFEGREVISLLQAASECQDRNHLERNIALQPAAHFQAGPIAQILIEHHKVGNGLQAELKCRFRTAGVPHTVACLLEQTLVGKRLDSAIFDQ